MSKKSISLFMIILLLFGCSKEVKDNKAHDDYYEKVDLLSNNLAFDEINNDFKVVIDKETSELKENHYTITINQKNKDYSKLQIMAMPLNYQYEDILPSYNVLEKDPKQYYDFKLHYYTDNVYTKFKVMLVYTYKKETIIKYYLVNVD